MDRIKEGIKGLLGKGKDDSSDDDEPEYRHRYDQRQFTGSNRSYKNSGTGISDARSAYRRPFGEALDDSHIRNGYDTRASSRGTQYRKPSESSPRGGDYPSARGTEYQRPYVGSEVASPRGEYVMAPMESPRDYQSTPRGSARRDSNVVELMVPMCCDKCKEKVREELGEVEGVESVRCDAPNSRVIVTGDESIDVDRCVKKAERAVKKKCELIRSGAGGGPNTSSRHYPPMEAPDRKRDPSMQDAAAAGYHAPRPTPEGMRDRTRDSSTRDVGAGTAGGYNAPRATPDGMRDVTTSTAPGYQVPRATPDRMPERMRDPSIRDVATTTAPGYQASRAPPARMPDGMRDSSIRDVGAGTAPGYYAPRATQDGMLDPSMREATAGTVPGYQVPRATPDRMPDRIRDPIKRDAAAGIAPSYQSPRATPDRMPDRIRDPIMRDAAAGIAPSYQSPRATPDRMRDPSIRDVGAGAAGGYETLRPTPNAMRDEMPDGIRAVPSSGPSPTNPPRLGRMPSFASGKVTPYDGRDVGLDYQEKDYTGFRRMPSFGKHQHHDAEYIASFDERSQPVDPRREVYAPRRMPSFDRHKNHDAEYVNAGDREYNPRTTAYESDPVGGSYSSAYNERPTARDSYSSAYNERSNAAGGSYSSAYNDRPAASGGSYSSEYNERPTFRSQVSFSKLPVENPNYMKHIAH